jgi:hypothetical protein
MILSSKEDTPRTKPYTFISDANKKGTKLIHNKHDCIIPRTWVPGIRLDIDSSVGHWAYWYKLHHSYIDSLHTGWYAFHSYFPCIQAGSRNDRSWLGQYKFRHSSMNWNQTFSKIYKPYFNPLLHEHFAKNGCFHWKVSRYKFKLL